jgi:hypothetical protein
MRPGALRQTPRDVGAVAAIGRPPATRADNVQPRVDVTWSPAHPRSA